MNIKEKIIAVSRHLLGDEKTYDRLIDRGIEIRGFRKFYSEENASVSLPERKSLIYMADGKYMHGGPTDRIRAMVSAYDFALKHGFDFKINHSSPVNLENFLVSNKYDWTIDASDISYNSKQSKPLFLYREDFDNVTALERQLDEHRQFHLYSCVDTVQEDFSKLFSELFKPSKELATALEPYEEILNEPYISVSFRLQNLLGDYTEWKFQPLGNEKQKKELIDSALDAIKTIAKANDVKKILVTADSPLFLEQAKLLENVVTVNGKSIHIDFNSSQKISDYIKPFIEFLLISKSKKVYLYHNKKYNTYMSNFPKYAAKLGDIDFEIFEA